MLLRNQMAKHLLIGWLVVQMRVQEQYARIRYMAKYLTAQSDAPEIRVVSGFLKVARTTSHRACPASPGAR